MALTLTDKDMEDLARMVDDHFRHREGAMLMGFLGQRIQAQRMDDMRARATIDRSAETVVVNGHAENGVQS